MNDRSVKSTSQCFYQTDLYTTFFGEYINDEIERRLFGDIDDIGSRSVRAFIQNDTAECHRHFIDFFSYIDSQKIRTPKGLDWIRKHYPNLNQVELMMEMQAIREMHCTIWIEGVREIVSAKKSEIKFILTDHPVTIYNRAFSPESEQCAYPDDPSIAPKGTQTLFPLDKDHCLILTNYEYAKDPDHENPLEKRTNARFNRNTITKTDALIRTRSLNEEEVTKINYVLKQRARRYIASFNKDWLFPEKTIATDWAEIHKVLLPPATEVHHFGGEIYVGYKDGSTHYQDAFGRTTPENKHLKKTKNTKVGRNDPCGCGSEKKYKKCCLKKGKDERPSWDARSIRERNLFFCYAVADILGLSKGKTWNDVRRELSNDQVKEIHGVYEFLWPPDTDIFSLLPKPDNELRALYTGIVDPRVISTFALGFTPYFNEVIIQHPFIHPTFVKPEFSPFESPHQHKQQTLKNVLLLLTLEPFIEAGFVNFIPNPCSFDQHLFRQMLSMADERSKHIKIGEKEMKLMEELNKEDIKRSIRMMPREIQKRQIVSTMPDLSSEQTEEMIKYTESLNMKDPFSLLQKDVFCDQGGQLTVTSMAPNFEISLFIAQATGSIILTDSPFRWKELKSAQHKVAGMTSYPWNNLSSLINSLKFAVTANPEISFYQRGGDDFKNLRKTLKEIYSTIQNNEGPLDANIMRRFKEELLTSHEIAMKKANNQDQYNFDAKVSSLAPKGGFVHNNVQRMLLTSGIEKHLNSVPMAMFVEHA